MFWHDRNLKVCTVCWLRNLLCPTPPQHSKHLQHQMVLKVSAGTDQPKGRPGVRKPVCSIIVRCPVISPNDLSLWGLCMQEVPLSVNYVWFAMFLDDHLYQPLLSMTFLRPFNGAVQYLHLYKRKKILMFAVKLATFAVISCKNKSQLTGKPVSGLKI